MQYKQKPLLFEAQGQGWVQAKKDKEEECNSEAWVRVWGSMQVHFFKACRVHNPAHQPTKQPAKPGLLCQPVMKGAPDRRRGRSASLIRGASVSRMVRPASSRRMEMKVRKPAACRGGANKGAGRQQAARQGQHAAFLQASQLCTESSERTLATIPPCPTGVRGYCCCLLTCMMSMAVPMARRCSPDQRGFAMRMIPQMNTPRSHRLATISAGRGRVREAGMAEE